MLTVVRIDQWDPPGEACVSEAWLRLKVQSCGYDVCTFAWPAGTVVPPQGRDRGRVAALDGMVRITLDGESAILTAGDAVHVPRGTVRRVEVVGPVPAHGFDAPGQL